MEAGWTLSQGPRIADHLGQYWQRMGQKAKAAHMYRLALAVDPHLDETKARLAALGLPESGDSTAKHVGALRPQDPNLRYSEELGKLRTLPVAGFDLTKGSADFLELVSSRGVEEVKYKSGDWELGNAVPALLKAGSGLNWPDAGKEKVVRRGIPSCSQYLTPHCSITFVPLGNSAQ